MGNSQKKYTLDGADLYKKTKELIEEVIKENKKCKLIVKNEEDKTLVEIPISVGAIFIFFAPVLVAVAGIGALVSRCSITVVYQEEE